MTYIKLFESKIGDIEYTPTGTYLLCVKSPDEVSSGMMVTIWKKYNLLSKFNRFSERATLAIKDDMGNYRGIQPSWTNDCEYTRGNINQSVIFTTDNSMEAYKKRKAQDRFDL